MRDRVVGSILGGALGDGWGRPFEGGARREHVTLPDELVVSDDTQLTLATCEAILDADARRSPSGSPSAS